MSSDETAKAFSRWLADAPPRGALAAPTTEPVPNAPAADALPAPVTAVAPSASALRRVDDLVDQIRFLDQEVARYRELVESERIHHARELNDQQLAADARLDQHRRDARRQTKSLHDSYRLLLSERQVELDQALSNAAGEHANQLDDERARHQEILDQERTRRDHLLASSRQQAIDELTDAYERSERELRAELAQAHRSRKRLQGELNAANERAHRAEDLADELRDQLAQAIHRADTSDTTLARKMAEAESRVTSAERRLESERQRSASTLIEVLERSAALAADADRARSEFAAELARTKHLAERGPNRAALDELAAKALQREAELEALIAELRSQIQPR